MLRGDAGVALRPLPEGRVAGGAEGTAGADAGRGGDVSGSGGVRNNVRIERERAFPMSSLEVQMLGPAL